MPVKQFADTSSVSIAYAIDAAATASELSAAEFNYVPFTTEGFALAKESQQSAAITSDRRPSGSKNTQGSASGSVGTELGYAPFVLDMLKLAVMNEWTEDTSAADGSLYATDGDIRQFFVVEKRIKGQKAGVKTNFFERYFGNLVNEATIEIGGSDLVSFTVNTMAAFGDTASADASTDADAGGLVTTYTKPESYEIADASNNVSKITLKDASGNPMEVVWSDATLTITNNVREQGGVGHEFAAGMTMGKVNASLSGTIYYYDDSVLNAHLKNESVSAELEISTSEGVFIINLPKLKAESPSANAQGENQDYTQSLTLNAERGTVNLDGADQECVVALVHRPAA